MKDVIAALLMLAALVGAWYWIAKKLGKRGSGGFVRHLAGGVCGFGALFVAGIFAAAVGLIEPEPADTNSKTADSESANKERSAPDETAIEAPEADDVVAQPSEEEPQSAEWYEHGTLHDASALEWQNATHANKLATAGDLIAAAFQRGKLSPDIASRIGGVDDIRPLAEELASQLDAAFSPEPDPDKNREVFANQKVNETAAILMVMMGWADLD